jgi:hypothetical protein
MIWKLTATLLPDDLEQAIATHRRRAGQAAWRGQPRAARRHWKLARVLAQLEFE